MQKVIVGYEELQAIQPLLRTALYGSTTPGGFIVLQSRDGNRYWSASDNESSVTVMGDPDYEEYVHLITPSLLRSAIDAATANDSLVLEQVLDGEDLYVQATVGPFTGRSLLPQCSHPLVNIHLKPNAVGAKADFRSIDLSSIAFAVWNGIDESESDGFADVSLVDGELTFTYGPTCETQTLKSEYLGASGSIYLRFEVRRLAMLMGHLLECDTVTLTFPLMSGGFVVIEGGDTTLRITPKHSLGAEAMNHVVGLIRDTCGEAAAHQDEDGSFFLRRRGNQIYGTMLPEVFPHTFRIYGVLLEEVSPSVELYEELNQLNLKSVLVKFAMFENSVMVQTDLLVQDLQKYAFLSAIDEVANAITKYSETLAVVFGGEASPPPEELRWQQYSDTLITAEVSPGKVIELNGDYGVLDWEFPDEVYVLSGYNPQGVEFDGRGVNPKIAADVMLAGGRLVYGEIIRSEDATPEPAIIAWGISRNKAREFGRKAGHDAIFELDEIDFRIVDCIGSRVDEQPRITGVIPLFESLYDERH